MPSAIPAFSQAQHPAPDRVVAAASGPSHTRAIQTAIDACAAGGGGRVVLRAGRHQAGTLVLRSGVTLHLEKDAVLFASPDLADYPICPDELTGARVVAAVPSALLTAEDADDIAVTGEGTIDGNGASFGSKRTEKVAWIEEKKAFGLWIPGFDNKSRPRPRAVILFVRCRGVQLHGVRLENSPAWMVHLLACDHVRIERVVVRGWVGGSNTDGLDLDGCCDVRIADCDIETGDDAIALKNTDGWGLKRPSRRITVERCRLASTTHGFTIGTETRDNFEEITLRDSKIEGADGHGVLTGIGIDMVDGARIRSVHIADVTIVDAIAPLHVRLGNAGRGQAVRRPGEITNILLEHVAIVRARGNCLLDGLPGYPLRDIVLRQVKLEFADHVDSAHILREVPEFDGEYPLNSAWRLLPAYGFYCRHIDGLELTRVSIATTVADVRPALVLEDVARFSSHDCEGIAMNA